MQIDDFPVFNILVAIEHYPLNGPYQLPKVEGYSEEQITEHLLYLHGLKCIIGVDASHMHGKAFLPTGGLTPAGHEYLMQMRAQPGRTSPPVSGFHP